MLGLVIVTHVGIGREMHRAVWHLEDAEAAKMLTRPYRAPWDRELKAVLG